MTLSVNQQVEGFHQTGTRMEAFPHCISCKIRGDQIYEGLEDRFFGVPGLFNLRHCSSCGLLWLDPRPIMEDIPKYYENYFTHIAPHEINPLKSDPTRFLALFRDIIRTSILCRYYGYHHIHERHIWCRFGHLLVKIPILKLRATYNLEELFPYFRKDLIIDVGCGKGTYLRMMKDLGWEVLGVEPDPEASRIARDVYGINVITGTLQKARLPNAIAYQVTMNHVLEHLPDPVYTLKECYRVLKTGGRLIIYTPNSESFGHKIFSKDWAYLDPPRHLFIFSPKSIYRILESSGFEKFYIKTTSKSAAWGYDASTLIYKNGKIKLNDISPQHGRQRFILKESLACYFGKECGEEIEVTVIKIESK